MDGIVQQLTSYLNENIDIPVSDNRYRIRKVCLIIFIETFVLCCVAGC